MAVALLTGVFLAGVGPPAAAQRVTLEVHGMAVAARRELVGGGVGVALRAGERLRLGSTVTGGTLDGVAGGRAEVLASFHLEPDRRRGAAPYAGVGLAIAATRTTTGEYLVVLLGMESRPAARSGWFVEAGVGGGVRMRFGWSVRR